MDSTLALIQKAHQGDKKARDTIFQENVGLVWSWRICFRLEALDFLRR